MKPILSRVSRHPFYGKSIVWFKLVTITGSAQVLIQAIGLISGILIIRQLPVKEYALYTLVNSMLGTMTVLADGGIASGVMAQAGKVWQDPDKLGKVVVSGIVLRRKFAVGSLLVAIPVLLYLLLHHEAGWLTAILIVLALIPTFNAALSDSLLEVAPKLRQDIKVLQRNQVSVTLARLALTLLTIFIFPYAYIIILATGIPRTWGNFKLRKISKRYANLDQKPDAEITSNILKVVKRILPGSIYYCVSSQVTIWIISAFGSTTSLAQVGALSRLSMFLGLFSTLFVTLIVPRFARLPSVKSILLKRFIIIQILLIALSIVIVMFVQLFSSKILWLLGSGFSGLTVEVVLIAIGSCVSLIGTSTNQLLSARGIIIPPVVFISSAIAVQVLVAFILPLNQVQGVLWYNIYTAFAIYLFRIIYLLLQIKKDENSL